MTGVKSDVLIREVLRGGGALVHIDQVVREVLRGGPAPVHVSMVVREVLRSSNVVTLDSHLPASIVSHPRADAIGRLDAATQMARSPPVPVSFFGAAVVAARGLPLDFTTAPLALAKARVDWLGRNILADSSVPFGAFAARAAGGITVFSALGAPDAQAGAPIDFLSATTLVLNDIQVMIVW